METLSKNTQAILLLCGRFPKKGGEKISPLNLTEYNRLRAWLIANQMQPADLLETDEPAPWQSFTDKKISHERLTALLNRGMQMTLALEAWQQKGIWVRSLADAVYPQRLKQRLKTSAPPILFGVGSTELLQNGGLAMVGSRHVNADGLAFTRAVAAKCAREGIQVVSGGAKGVDETAMLAALAAGGTVIGVLACKLAQAAVARQWHDALVAGRLALISPFSPQAPFSVGTAMGRNKHIYALSDAGLAVDATAGKGGTWTGAVENLKHNWVPLYARQSDAMPTGNAKLLELGARPMNANVLNANVNLRAWLRQPVKAAAPAKPYPNPVFEPVAAVAESNDATAVQGKLPGIG